MEPNDYELLGPCGCVDYHMADCPIRTASHDALSEVEFDDSYDDIEDFRRFDQ